MKSNMIEQLKLEGETSVARFSIDIADKLNELISAVNNRENRLKTLEEKIEYLKIANEDNPPKELWDGEKVLSPDEQCKQTLDSGSTTEYHKESSVKEDNQTYNDGFFQLLKDTISSPRVIKISSKNKEDKIKKHSTCKHSPIYSGIMCDDCKADKINEIFDELKKFTFSIFDTGYNNGLSMDSIDTDKMDRKLNDFESWLKDKLEKL